MNFTGASRNQHRTGGIAQYAPSAKFGYSVYVELALRSSPLGPRFQAKIGTPFLKEVKHARGATDLHNLYVGGNSDAGRPETVFASLPDTVPSRTHATEH